MDPREAVELLAEVVCDFPFANEKHLAAWIAHPVTLVARYAFGGRAPLFFVDGNRSGAGKGMLLDADTMIYESRPATRYSYPTDQEELRKVITTIVMSGVAYHIIDNIKGKFGGGVIEKALTDARWSDRLLGVNRDIDLPINHITLATGNNCQLTSDMVRRTLYCRLESPLEDPSRRNDFKHKLLLDYVRENRRRLIMAALSIPAQYVKAGQPDQGLPAWGGFQEWSDLVRNALVWAGLPDPDTRSMLATQVDDDSASWRRSWTAGRGWRRSERRFTAPRSARAGFGRCVEELPRKNRRHALGQLLKHHRGRVLNGRKFEKTDGKRPKVGSRVRWGPAVWWLSGLIPSLPGPVPCRPAPADAKARRDSRERPQDKTPSRISESVCFGENPMSAHARSYRLAEEAAQRRLEELSDVDAETISDVSQDLCLARLLAERCA